MSDVTYSTVLIVRKSQNRLYINLPLDIVSRMGINRGEHIEVTIKRREDLGVHYARE